MAKELIANESPRRHVNAVKTAVQTANDALLMHSECFRCLHIAQNLSKISINRQELRTFRTGTFPNPPLFRDMPCIEYIKMLTPDVFAGGLWNSVEFYSNHLGLRTAVKRHEKSGPEVQFLVRWRRAPDTFNDEAQWDVSGLDRNIFWKTNA